MRKLLVAAAAVILFCAAPALADPVGKYAVEGTNPNGTSYSGIVSVERTGQTYKVDWVIGRQRFSGTGIGNKDFLAVSYVSGDQTGLALYAPDGDGWKGVWTYAGGKQMGTDLWKRR
jgi:hypothetical protein